MSNSLRLYGLTIARQAPLSMVLSRQEYWSGLPCPPPWELPDPRIEPKSLRSCAFEQVLYHSHHLGSPFEAVCVCVCVCVSCSVVSDSAIPGTVAHQSPLSMEFSRQEYWSGLPFPSPGDLPDPVFSLKCFNLVSLYYLERTAEKKEYVR